jgi:hypothetical protein
VILKDPKLQYIIELKKEGLLQVDDEARNVPVQERLLALRQMCMRWRSLDWTQIHQVSLLGPDVPRHSRFITRGVFASGVFATSHRFTAQNGEKTGWLRAEFLPSRDKPGRRILWHDLGLETDDFAFDPSQDLIAYICPVQQFVALILLISIIHFLPEAMDRCPSVFGPFQIIRITPKHNPPC